MKRVDPPLKAAEANQADSNGRNRPPVPGPVPVLVREVGKSAKNGHVNCSCQLFLISDWGMRRSATRLTGTNETASDLRSEDALLGLHVEL